MGEGRREGSGEGLKTQHTAVNSAVMFNPLNAEGIFIYMISVLMFTVLIRHLKLHASF